MSSKSVSAGIFYVFPVFHTKFLLQFVSSENVGSQSSASWDYFGNIATTFLRISFLTFKMREGNNVFQDFGKFSNNRISKPHSFVHVKSYWNNISFFSSSNNFASFSTFFVSQIWMQIQGNNSTICCCDLLQCYLPIVIY